MAELDGRSGAFVNSLVGEGSFFRGDIAISGLLRIDGDFSGDIKTPGKVFVGRTGRADCTINAASVVVGGIVRGSITASEKVVILSSAVIIGSITSPRLIAEEGVIFDGVLSIAGSPLPPSSEDSDNSRRGWLSSRFFTRPSREEAPRLEAGV
ncbi:MAG: polymer-forming cytoskeletal protein [Spirochaetales bacterium]|jgi:cytoskeletal protein CcmA (bactofilin family)|nr:polymer-forming cytoskeletal protein [Spirochaetales bacterium]